MEREDDPHEDALPRCERCLESLEPDERVRFWRCPACGATRL